MKTFTRPRSSAVASVVIAVPLIALVATMAAACAAAAVDDPAITDLRAKHLRLPLDNADIEKVKRSFSETHNGHPHEAVDLLAPRDTPIHAVEDGTIAKLFESKAGGHTIYQSDPTGNYCYYYAHLDHYAAGLHDGDHVTRGEIIGYVGTSGDAPPNTPHLHFTIFQLTPARHWWEGRAIDPYLVYRP